MSTAARQNQNAPIMTTEAVNLFWSKLSMPVNGCGGRGGVR